MIRKVRVRIIIKTTTSNNYEPPRKPVACNYVLLSMKYVLLLGLVAYSFGNLAVPRASKGPQLRTYALDCSQKP